MDTHRCLSNSPMMRSSLFVIATPAALSKVSVTPAITSRHRNTVRPNIVTHAPVRRAVTPVMMSRGSEYQVSYHGGFVKPIPQTQHVGYNSYLTQMVTQRAAHAQKIRMEEKKQNDLKVQGLLRDMQHIQENK